MTAQLGLGPEALVSLHQVHSADAQVVARAWSRAERPRADGMATATPGWRSGSRPPIAARCCSATRRPGWSGRPCRLERRALGRPGSDAGRHGGARCATRDILAVLGPTISAKAYEVGADFVARFTAADQDNARFFRERPGTVTPCSICPGYIGARLARAGVGRFVDLGLCTYSDESRFYS
jgi:copper oxidase (laccase) domain-containing protein